MKIELDLSNYATKADLRNETCVHTFKFAKNFDLASLKWENDNLESDPVNLEKLKGCSR